MSPDVEFWHAVVIAFIAAFPGTLVGIAALRSNKKTQAHVNGHMKEMLRLTAELAGIKATKTERDRVKQLDKG